MDTSPRQGAVRIAPKAMATLDNAARQSSLLSTDVCRLPDLVGTDPTSDSNTNTPTATPVASVIGNAHDGFPRPTAQRQPTRATSAARPLPQQKTVIIVVNVLPLVFERNASNSGWNVEWSSSSISLFYRNLVSDNDHYRPLFIGCPEVFVSRDEEATVEHQLQAFHCVPVFLDPVVAHRYFQGFCKGVLWPIFHNVVDVYNSAKLTLDPCTTSTQEPTEPTTPTRGSKTPAWCDPASWNPAAQDTCWGDYCSVNRTFAKRIIESYNDGYMIWIHDFHFLMLPSYLLRKLRTAMIATYLHVPFPSSEIFRCLAMRTEILRAMLCADHIGFLIFEHARHFLTSCKRLLGLNYKSSADGMLVLEYNGRKVNISCSHIEPDIRYLHRILDQHHTDRTDSAQQFRKKLERFVYDPTTNKRKFVIASVDRLEGLGGLPLKLRAFDRFLALNPSKRGSVVLIQIGISLDSRPNDYHQTRDYVQKFAQEINRRWSTGTSEWEQVVYFEERAKATCAERMHLWRMSDVYIDTCIRYGLTLLPFEFLVAQKRNLEQASNDDGIHQFGAMVVSEFASYSRILNGCLLVNPWKTDDIVSALVKASEMQYYEKLNRFQLNYKFLVERAEHRWAERLLKDFEVLKKQKQELAEAQGTVEVGFGFEYRVMQFASGFEKLDTDTLVRTSTRSPSRLFVFDYGGTLSWTTSILEEDGAAHHHHFQTETASLSPSKLRGNDTSGGCSFGQAVLRSLDGQVRTPLSLEARVNLQTLCSDPRNVVFIMSTGHRAELDAEFGMIPFINLVADNGLFVKKANAFGPGSSEWECIHDHVDDLMTWKDEVNRIMQSYASRTNGAFLIVGEATMLYDYRHCDPEYGEIQALELYEQLRQIIKKGEATIHRGKGFVQVEQYGVSKAIAMRLILHHLKQSVGVPEFAMYIGDDESDEQVFKALHAFAESESTLAHAFTCTVGMKPSEAKHYVDSVTDVLALIHAIAVRLRHGSSNHLAASSFLSKGYLDRFLAHDGSLVDREYLHALTAEAAGLDLTSDSFSVSPAGYDGDGDGRAHSSLHRSHESSGSSEWLALGAGLAVGAAVGLAVAPRPVGQWLRSQLQRLTG